MFYSRRFHSAVAGVAGFFFSLRCRRRMSGNRRPSVFHCVDCKVGLQDVFLKYVRGKHSREIVEGRGRIHKHKSHSPLVFMAFLGTRAYVVNEVTWKLPLQFGIQRLILMVRASLLGQSCGPVCVFASRFAVGQTWPTDATNK